MTPFDELDSGQATAAPATDAPDPGMAEWEALQQKLAPKEQPAAGVPPGTLPAPNETTERLESDGFIERARRDFHQRVEGTRLEAIGQSVGNALSEFGAGVVDPQQSLELAKGVIPGAIQFGGTALQGASILDPIEATAAGFERHREEILSVPGMTDDQVMQLRQKIAKEWNERSPAVAAAAQDAITSIRNGESAESLNTRFPSPTPVTERPLYRAGETVSTFGRELIPAAPGYETSGGRQIGEGLGSLVAGLPFGLIGRLPAAGVFGTSGIGEALQRAVSFDQTERAAGRDGLTQEQIAAAALLGVGPGMTDLAPMELLLHNLRAPGMTPAAARTIAQGIGQVGGRIFFQAAIEGSQEAFQQFLQNVISWVEYNPDQKLTADILGNLGVGTAVGGIAQTGQELGRAVMPFRRVARAGRTQQPQAEPQATPQPTEQPTAAPTPEPTPYNLERFIPVPPETAPEASPQAETPQRAPQPAPQATAAPDAVQPLPADVLEVLRRSAPELAERYAEPVADTATDDEIARFRAAQAPEGSVTTFLNSGDTMQVVTPGGEMTLDAFPEIVELADLHKATGRLQPRDRSRSESDIAIREIAANLDPLQLLPSRVTDSGAPIVNQRSTVLGAQRNVVISGNGRIAALQQVYTDPALRDKADAYRQALGPAARGYKQPVAVMFVEPDSESDLERLADLSNRPRIAGMSATERAMRDAAAAGPEIMGLFQGGEFRSPANNEFFRAFTDRVVSTAERGAFSRDGELTQEGNARMRAAVLAAAYGDQELLSRLLESTDDNVRSLTGALQDAAGAFIRLKEAIRLGEADAQFDIAPHVVDVVRRIADLRTRGIRPDAFLAQQDAFTQVDPLVEALLRSFYTEDLARPLSRQKIAEFLNGYAQEAAKHTAEGLIPDTTAPGDIIASTRERVGRADTLANRLAAAQTDLLRSPGASRSDAGEGGGQAPGPARSGSGRAAGSQRGEASQRDAGLGQRFAGILAGKLPRSKWAGALGLTEAQMKPLIKQAVSAGLVRLDRDGLPRRTKAARETLSIDPLRTAMGNVDATEASDAITELYATLSDRRSRRAAATAHALGKTFVVPEIAIEATLQATAPLMHAVPSDVRVGVLWKLEPVKSTKQEIELAKKLRKTPANVRAYYRMHDGKVFSELHAIDPKNTSYLDARALFFGQLDNPFGTKSVVFLTFGHMGTADQFADSLRGKLGHELIHALRHGGHFTAGEWAILRSASHQLNLLDMDQRSWGQLINDPEWPDFPARATTRQMYENGYAHLPRDYFAEVMDQEAIAFAFDLFLHGGLGAEQLGPAYAIFNRVASGEFGRGGVAGSGIAVPTLPMAGAVQELAADANEEAAERAVARALSNLRDQFNQVRRAASGTSLDRAMRERARLRPNQLNSLVAEAIGIAGVDEVADTVVEAMEETDAEAIAAIERLADPDVGPEDYLASFEMLKELRALHDQADINLFAVNNWTDEEITALRESEVDEAQRKALRKEYVSAKPTKGLTPDRPTEADRFIREVREFERSLANDGKSAGDISAALRNRFGVEVAPEAIASGMVWWRVDDIMKEESGARTSVRWTPKLDLALEAAWKSGLSLKATTDHLRELMDRPRLAVHTVAARVVANGLHLRERIVWSEAMDDVLAADEVRNQTDGKAIEIIAERFGVTYSKSTISYHRRRMGHQKRFRYSEAARDFVLSPEGQKIGSGDALAAELTKIEGRQVTPKLALMLRFSLKQQGFDVGSRETRNPVWTPEMNEAFSKAQADGLTMPQIVALLKQNFNREFTTTNLYQKASQQRKRAAAQAENAAENVHLASFSGRDDAGSGGLANSIRNEFGFKDVIGLDPRDADDIRWALRDLAATVGFPATALGGGGRITLDVRFLSRSESDERFAPVPTKNPAVRPFLGGYHSTGERAGEIMVGMHGVRVLPHEMFHAIFDHGLNNFGAGLLSDATSREGIREPVLQAWQSLERSVKGTQYEKSGAEADASRGRAYFGTMPELLARAFEAYVGDKASAQGKSIASSEGIAHANSPWPRPVVEFPQGQERERINAAFDNLFSTLSTRPGKLVGTELFAFSGRDDGPVKGLRDIISDLKAALNLTVTQNRYGVRVVDRTSGRRWHFGAKPTVRGQYDPMGGVARVPISTDIDAIAEQGGRHVERMFGASLDAFKRTHADELGVAPAPNSPLPRLNPTGFSGFDLDADTQTALVEAANGLREWRKQMADRKLRNADPAAFQALSARTNIAARTLERRLGPTISRALVEDILIGGMATLSDTAYRTSARFAGGTGAVSEIDPAKVADYVRERYSMTGTPSPRAASTATDRQLSDGFTDFFRRYVTDLDGVKRDMPGVFTAFEDFLDVTDPGLLENIERLQLALVSKEYKQYRQATTVARGRADLVSDADRRMVPRVVKWLKAIGQFDTWQGMASVVYEGAIDQTHSNFLLTKRLLEQADANKVVDAEGRAISLAVHQNPAKLIRSVSDSFKTGMRWLQDGMPNYRSSVIYEVRRQSDASVLDRLPTQADADRFASTVAEPTTIIPVKAYRSKSINEAMSLAMDGRKWSFEVYQDFGMYLESRRAVEEWKRWKAQGSVAQADGKGLRREPHRIGMEEHQERVRLLERDNPQFIPAAAAVYDFLWQSAIHDFQAGRLTPEELDYRATRRTFYVPWGRDMSASLGLGVRGVRAQARRFMKDKAFQGSQRDVINPLETIVDQAFFRAAATHMNEVVKTYADLAERVGPGGAAIAERVTRSEEREANDAGFEKLVNDLMAAGYQEEDAREMAKRVEADFSDVSLLLQYAPGQGTERALVIPLYENGVRNYLRINDPEWAAGVYNSLNGIGRQLSDLFLDFVAKPAAVLRTTVVTSPAFIVPNIIRDAWSAWILTGSILDPRTYPGVTQVRGLYHELTQSDMAKLYSEVSGAMGGQNVAALSKVSEKTDVLALEEKGLHIRPVRMLTAAGIGGAAGFAMGGPVGAGFGALLGGALHRGVSKFVPTIAHMADLSETATRLGVFTEAYRAALAYNPNLTPYQAAQEAAFVARDLIDFSRHGSHMMAVARTVTFMNANLQGVDKAVRTLLARSDRGMAISTTKLTALMAAGATAGLIAGPVAGAVGALAAPVVLTNLAARSAAVRALLAPFTKKDMGIPLSRDEEQALSVSAKAWTNLMLYSFTLLAFAAWYRDDEEYKAFSPRLKMRNQPVKLLGEWRMFPKAFEWAVPSNVIETAIDAQYGGDPRFWERVREGLWDVLAPPGIPQTARLWSDVRANHNTLTGRPIVPEHLRADPPELQFSAYASQFAIGLSQAVNSRPALRSTVETVGGAVFATPNFELTPAIIDYMMRTGLGYWGQDIQKASDVTTIGGSRVADFPLIGSAARRFQADPNRANDALDTYFKLMGQEHQGYRRAAAGYKGYLDKYGAAGANTYLATLEDREQQAYALLESSGSPAERRSHPLNRLKDIVTVTYDLEREITLRRLADTSLTGEPSPIVLSPAKRAELRDALAQVRAIEAHNALVVLQHRQFAPRQLIDVQPALGVLRAISPEAFIEYDLRLSRKKVVDFADVQFWPRERDQLMRDWQEAVDREAALVRERRSNSRPQRLPIGGSEERAPGP